MQNKIIIIVVLISILGISCSTQKTTIWIVGGNPIFIEAYNGKRLLIRDSLQVNIQSGISRVFTTRYNFSDSISVALYIAKGVEPLRQTVKVEKAKNIHIESFYFKLNIYSSDQSGKAL